MSAFIVGKETIDRIVTYMTSHKHEDQLGYYYPELSKAYGGDHNKLGQALVNMNTRAVDERYDENNPIKIYRHSYEYADNVQVYKSLQGYLYQCAEGDVYECPLYNEVQSIENSLAADIIRALPAYENAAWA